MFAVIYSFRVKPDCVRKFEIAWKSMTILLLEYEGSLGSRLHKQDDLHYIAYAQWPDKNTWEKAGENLPDISKNISKTMKESCDAIKTLYSLDVVDDVLKTQS